MREKIERTRGVDMNENEKQIHEKLLRLIKENPELPVVPFVDAYVTGDDSGYWLGSWGAVAVDEYLVSPYDDMPILCKSLDAVFDTLDRYLSYEEFEKLPDSEMECRKIYESLPWKKAIIVYITLPE